MDKSWLCIYPRPEIIAYDHGNELLGHAFKNYIIKNKYGIKPKFATTENPQANSILEPICQFIANLVRNFDWENNYLYQKDP